MKQPKSGHLITHYTSEMLPYRFIDSGVLGLLTNPKKQGKPAQCEDWLYSLLAKGVYVVRNEK